MDSDDDSLEPYCPFLELPPREIRDEIHRHLVIYNGMVVDRRRRCPSIGTVGLGILFTNKQIFDEAIQIYYQENYFHFTGEDPNDH